MSRGTGKALAAGFIEGPGTSHAVVVRFNPDGTLDSSFGSGGIATAPSSSSLGFAIALQSGGILVCGRNGTDFYAVRFNLDGSVDTTFGVNGERTIDFGGNADTASAVAVNLEPGPLNQTAVLAGGTFVSGQTRIALTRLDTNGNIDTSFGTNGRVISIVGGANDIAFAPGGGIVAAGAAGTIVPNPVTDFVAVKFNPNGTPDTTFGGGDGIATADFLLSDIASGVAVPPDGSVVLAGTANDVQGTLVDALARFLPNGDPDPSFGAGGKVTGTPITNRILATDVVVNVFGQIVTSGHADFSATGGSDVVVLSRYFSNGSPDPTFGSAGRVVTPFVVIEDPIGLVIQNADSKIVIATGMLGAGGLVARFNGNGAAPPPPPPPAFDICIDNGPLKFRFNSTTGAYEFRDCAKGFLLGGTGTVTVNSCKIQLQDGGPGKNSGREILVIANTCTKVGTVSVKITSPLKNYVYTDNDITQGSCTCP